MVLIRHSLVSRLKSLLLSTLESTLPQSNLSFDFLTAGAKNSDCGPKQDETVNNISTYHDATNWPGSEKLCFLDVQMQSILNIAVLDFLQQILQVLLSFREQGCVICIVQVAEKSSSNPDDTLFFIKSSLLG